MSDADQVLIEYLKDIDEIGLLFSDKNLHPVLQTVGKHNNTAYTFKNLIKNSSESKKIALHLTDGMEENFDDLQGHYFENYGSMIKEYVEVPEEVLMDKAVIIEYMKKSHEYAKTLKPKPTKKVSKSPASSDDNASAKKVTHDVGKTYKNGQLKSEIKGDQLINYYEDGSIKAQGRINNERMEGKWIFNRKGGQLWQIGHFNKDVKNGEWIRYDSKGKVAYHVVFEKDKVVEKIV